jgi:hypothetical protein
MSENKDGQMPDTMWDAVGRIFASTAVLLFIIILVVSYTDCDAETVVILSLIVSGVFAAICLIGSIIYDIGRMRGRQDSQGEE